MARQAINCLGVFFPRHLWLALAWAVAASLLALQTGQAAETRLALVIGNSAYTSKSLPPLGNPVHDASLIQKKLKEVGFDVDLVENADRVALEKSFRTFSRKVEAAGRDAVAVVYYAGHGIQDSTQANYLIPVDADIQAQSDLVDQALPVDIIVKKLELAAPKIALVILDACRSNATPASTRGGTRGLGVQQETHGILIAFSTEPGKTSQDGDGDNSPYALALAAEIAKPNIDVEQMFKKVRISVMETTKNEQVPLVSGVLNNFFFLVPGTAVQVPEKSKPASAPVDILPPKGVSRDPDMEYSRAVLTDTVENYEMLLNDFPTHPKRANIVALIERKREEVLWKQAEDATDDNKKAQMYGLLLMAFDHGAYAGKARQRLNELNSKGSRPSLPPVDPPAPVQPKTAYYYVTGLDPAGDNWLALRNFPSGTSGWSTTRMGPNTLLTLLGREGEWMNVRLLSGETGWASSRFITCCRAASDVASVNIVVPPVVRPPVPPPQNSFYYVTGLNPNGDNWLALRNAPSSTAPWSSTRMGPDTLLAKIGEDGEWMHVRLLSGETGWANAKFIACCRGAGTVPVAHQPGPPPSAGNFHYVDGLDPKGFNWLALRTAPSSTAPWSPTHLAPGTLLTVMDISGDWLHVRLRSGETGWTSTKFVFCCRSGP